MSPHDVALDWSFGYLPLLSPTLPVLLSSSYKDASDPVDPMKPHLPSFPPSPSIISSFVSSFTPRVLPIHFSFRRLVITSNPRPRRFQQIVTNNTYPQRGSVYTPYSYFFHPRKCVIFWFLLDLLSSPSFTQRGGDVKSLG
jgi:hypothetical protein